MAKKILTLNIGAASVQLAEYEAGAKGALKLLKYGTAQLAAPLDGGNAETILAPAILEIVKATGIKPGPLSIAVPGQMVFPKFAAIPMAGGEEKFEQMIRYEIEQTIPFPVDEMICDRQVIGDTESGDKSVMIIAAKVDQIESITNAVASVGFTVELVDVAPIALTNVLHHNNPGSENCVILLDIGAKTTSLVICEGDKFYNRSIPIAGNTFTKEISNALGCSPEEAEDYKKNGAYVSVGGITEDEDETADRVSKVCRSVATRINAEVSRSINFYRSQQKGGSPVKLYLTGGSALLPQLDQFFMDSLGIEVEFLNPFEVAGVAPTVDAAALETDAAFLAATTGLAIHAAGVSRFAINLLPLSLISERAEKAKVPFIFAGGALLIAALVLVMLGVNRDTASITAQRDEVQAKLENLKNYDKKVTAEQTKLESALAEAEAVRQLLVTRGQAVARLSAVKDSLRGGMWIQSWENNAVTIRSWADSVKAAPGKDLGDMLVDSLKKKAAVDPEGVKLSSKQSVGKDAQVDQFTVEVKFK